MTNTRTQPTVISDDQLPLETVRRPATRTSQQNAADALRAHAGANMACR